MRDAIERQLANPDVQVIITTGGTGITSRDSTFEAVSGMLWKRLDGFGELFRDAQLRADRRRRDDEPRRRRHRSPGASSSSLPGSEAAVRLALEKLSRSPELGISVRESGSD